jgi:xanthine dehydrogenase small subunit
VTPVRDTIRFLYRGRLRELRDLEPTMTVLRYLREVEKRRGTKEGCAEGDCGACTVVLGSPDGDQIRYQAVNSCIQFLPTLDGKLLLTVEDLQGRDGALHPVQKAMVEANGTQCGFCTPGFVMSLFALGRETGAASRREIADALAGNLCRCTGYGTIVEAARGMGGRPDPDPVEEREAAFLEALHRIRPEGSLALESRGRRFFAPSTLDQLAELLMRHPEATVLAGGTDVGLWVTKQHRELPTLVHVGHVRELQEIRDLGDAIEIGAAVTYSEAYDLIAGLYPDFGELLRRLGSRQIRNLGTIGGNIANGSPIGDTPPALIAVGATLRLNQGGARREMPLEDYFVDYGVQDRRPGEFVEAVRFPKPDGRRIFRAYKLSKRFDQDISALCGAFSLALDQERVRDVRICYGGMAATPRRALHCERALSGAVWNEATVEAAMAALTQDFAPIDDMRASKDYRMRAAQNLLYKVFVETREAPARTRVLEATEAS